MNVLVVGVVDHDFVNMLADRYLSEFNCSVLFAQNVAKAVEVLTNSSFVNVVIVCKTHQYCPTDEDVMLLSCKSGDSQAESKVSVYVTDATGNDELLANLDQFEKKFVDELSVLAETFNLDGTKDLFSKFYAKRDSRREEYQNSGNRVASGPDSLTKRQKEVLRLLCEGLSNKEIANELFTAESTIKAHCKAIYKTLGVMNRTQAVTHSLHHLDKTGLREQ